MGNRNERLTQLLIELENVTQLVKQLQIRVSLEQVIADGGKAPMYPVTTYTLENPRNRTKDN